MKNFIGIDIGGTSIKFGLIDQNGKIVKKTNIKTKSTRNFELVVDNIVDEIFRLIGKNQIVGIGIGCPGAINAASGVVEYSPNLAWRNVPLAQMIFEKTGKVVKIANDASVAALGEHKFGAGKGSEYTDTALITLGTGVGSGVVVKGELFDGFQSMGGEIGHTVIRENGKQCSCGRKGCFEAYSSATALIRETRAAMTDNPETAMWAYVNSDLNKVDGRTAFETAKKGDEVAQGVVDRYINTLAEGILNIIAIFRSQAVILGGGVSAQGICLTEPLQKIINELRYGGPTSLPCEILIAELGNDAGIIGAASLIMDAIK